MSAPLTIGVLGGMGPAATVDFLAKIVAATPANSDQEHLPVVVWSNPLIPDRTAALLDPRQPSPVPALRQGAQQLEKAGADLIAIPCNTAHHWHGLIQEATRIPVLHIADVAIEVLRRELPLGGTVGLMCTDGTLASGYYAGRLVAAGFGVTVPGAEQQSLLMDSIRGVKSGQRARATEGVLQVARQLLDGGADELLLGCTELPVALEPYLGEIPCLDATATLARACVEAARAGADLGLLRAPL